MKANKPVTNWWIDAGLLIGFLVSFLLDFTGLTLHQWLGVAVGVGAGVHLLLHWSWFKSVTLHLFGRTSSRARAFYAVDVSILLGFSLILLSGLVISTWLALPLGSYALWKNLHVVASVFTLWVVVLKIGLHWRWIVKVVERHIWAPQSSKTVKSPARPVYAPINTERRKFLSLMGLVGVAASLSLISVMVPDADAAASASLAEQGSSAAPQSSSTSVSTSQCTVRCNHRCSYPGHCRRYTDANSNNRCDLGECA